MLQRGGTSFLIGLLFGDVTGSSAVIFVTRSLFDASYSREGEDEADAFAVETWHALGRSPAPMGELLLRITGAQENRMIGILMSHPLTEERRELMRQEDRPRDPVGRRMARAQERVPLDRGKIGRVFSRRALTELGEADFLVLNLRRLDEPTPR